MPGSEIFLSKKEDRAFIVMLSNHVILLETRLNVLFNVFFYKIKLNVVTRGQPRLRDEVIRRLETCIL